MSTFFTHHKRGGTYAVVGTGKIQSDIPLEDMAEVVIYIHEEGTLWARPPSEFYDGRMIAIQGDKGPTLQEVTTYYAGLCGMAQGALMAGVQQLNDLAGGNAEMPDEVRARIQAIADGMQKVLVETGALGTPAPPPSQDPH